MRPYIFLALTAGLLNGCAPPPPPPPPPTIVNITMTATADVNGAAPIAMRVYQLGTPANFNNAEFFQLYRADAATLTTDLVKREDIMLNPGQTKTESLTLDPPVKAIGFFGGFRDYQTAEWRGSADIPPHQTTNITVTASVKGITVKTVTVPPPPKAPS